MAARITSSIARRAGISGSSTPISVRAATRAASARRAPSPALGAMRGKRARANPPASARMASAAGWRANWSAQTSTRIMAEVSGKPPRTYMSISVRPSSVPSAKRRSAPAIRSRVASRLGEAGTTKGCPCIMPRALVVWITGASSVSASACNAAPCARIPPPARIVTRPAPFSRSAACASTASLPVALAGAGAGAGKGGQSIGITSVGTSRCTGPGRPVVICAKAQSSAGPT